MLGLIAIVPKVPVKEIGSPYWVEISGAYPNVLGGPIEFTLRVEVDPEQVVQIVEIDMLIYKRDQREAYSLICENLPLTGKIENYQTAGGAVEIKAKPNPFRSFWKTPPVIAVDYEISWDSPRGWPGGEYEVRIEMLATGLYVGMPVGTLNLVASEAG